MHGGACLGVAVAAEVEEAGAAALGAHLGALRYHEVHEARAAPGCDEDVAGGDDGAAVVAGRGLVRGREGRQRGRDRGALAAARGAAALLFLILLVVIVVAAVDVASLWPRAGVRANGRHGGEARRGAGDRRRGVRRLRGGEGQRARVDGRAPAVFPVDVVNLPRLQKSAQMHARKMGEMNSMIRLQLLWSKNVVICM
jgi:hypothetical protein